MKEPPFEPGHIVTNLQVLKLVKLDSMQSKTVYAVRCLACDHEDLVSHKRIKERLTGDSAFCSACRARGPKKRREQQELPEEKPAVPYYQWAPPPSTLRNQR